mmetsp:Transcript_31886/g.67031  ORF Transcript_31886/g.67031 Transcript_31886/m.67031 type:complete len:375 (-) Transcript_31886:229-1353(-)|eukprot:CAMPEP_0172325140 /NCGR_PEP_ID=MMETSP1058-20130122/53244_1 /TAXON_ID=83371 /ORGANISM="Detonula confervacea, Strain CCMP 353" /LENGTH=374 /DNA_ID=CAMNT_0013041607 /DNA_START=39 /DNA_END=1163 /DNA_ORIENTATION=+
MAPTKPNRKTKTKLTAQRKSSRRKSSSAANLPRPGTQDKENASPIVNGEDSPQPKTDDPHEQNWWKINVEKAAALIERCMKAYNWDRVETKKILNSYRQFLSLKKEHADWDATYLYPCWPVDQMWLHHSQMEDYDYDMRNLLGHVVNRYTLAVGADDAVDVTKEALKQRFGSVDEELWNVINVCIVDQLGEEETIEVNMREPLSTFFERYAQKKEESVEKFQFVFDRKTINDDNTDGEATPMRLGIDRSNNKIRASHIEKVAINIRYASENKERGFLIDKTSMISTTFDEFAKEVLETERFKLVFLFQEKRVYGYESPVVFNMKCRDNTIEVVAVESYKCKSCICCNPNQNIEKDTSKDTGVQEDSSDAASFAD